MGPDLGEIVLYMCFLLRWSVLINTLSQHLCQCAHCQTSESFQFSLPKCIRKYWWDPRDPIWASALGFMYILSEFPPQSMVALFQRPCKGPFSAYSLVVKRNVNDFGSFYSMASTYVSLENNTTLVFMTTALLI